MRRACFVVESVDLVRAIVARPPTSTRCSCRLRACAWTSVTTAATTTATARRPARRCSRLRGGRSGTRHRRALARGGDRVQRSDYMALVAHRERVHRLLDAALTGLQADDVA